MSDTPESVRERAAKLRNDGDPWEVPRMLERYADLLEQRKQLKDSQWKMQMYVVAGGLVNPEMMDHRKVRDMIIEAMDRLNNLLGISDE